MDPIRRFLLLALVASVILAEPASARACFVDARHQPQDVSAVAANRLIQRLVVAFRRTAQSVDAVARPIPRRPDRTASTLVAQVGFVPALLCTHEFRPPPPAFRG